MGEENKVLVVEKSPALSMLEAAINSGRDPDKLLKFYELHERHEANEARKAYVKAMAKFRGSCPSIGRTKKAYNSNYAGLAETLDIITKTMSECGLTHSWETTQENNKIGVTCWLTHEFGHKEKTTLYAGADESGKKSPIQAIASTISYLERYTLFAILGLASKEMDNDGNSPQQETVTEIYDRKTKEHDSTINTIIDSIASDDLSSAVEAWAELDNEDRQVLWLSHPKCKKHGVIPCFTLEERKVIQSNEWAVIRDLFYKNKESK